MTRLPCASPALLTLVAVLAIVVALTGCTTTRTVETPLADRIPASLLSCRERPALGPIDRQSDVARYVVDLDTAGADCRRKIEAINQIVQEDEQPGE